MFKKHFVFSSKPAALVLMLVAFWVSTCVSAADGPCGEWIHEQWAQEGGVTWTNNVNGDPTPSIAPASAVERTVWRDPCEGTTQDPEDRSRLYVLESDEAVYDDSDGKWYREVVYRATSSCGGPDSIVWDSHALPLHWNAEPAISGGEITAPVEGNRQVVVGGTVPCEVEEATDEDTWTVWGGESGTDTEDVTYKWTSQGNTGSFSDNGEGPSVTWTAPNQAGNYVLTCTIDDSWTDQQTGVMAPNTGSRNDGALPRTVTIEVKVNPRKVEVFLRRSGLTDENRWGVSSKVAATGGGGGIKVKVTDLVTGLPVIGAQLDNPIIDPVSGPADYVAATASLNGNTTDANGEITGSFNAGNRIESVAVKIGSSESGTGSGTIHQTWDEAEDFDYDEFFFFGISNPVKFRPKFLDEEAEEIFIGGHSMRFSVDEVSYWDWSDEIEDYDVFTVTRVKDPLLVDMLAGFDVEVTADTTEPPAPANNNLGDRYYKSNLEAYSDSVDSVIFNATDLSVIE